MKNKPIIYKFKTDRLFVKRMELNDITNDYINWLNDFDTNKYLEVRFMKQDRVSVESYVNRNLVDEACAFHFGLFEREKRRLIGTVTLNRLDYHHLTANISFVIGHRDARGRGYATEAVHAASDFMFNDRGFYKLWGGYYQDNISAEKVFKKCGFEVEGRLAKKLVNYKNERVDHIFVGLLADEFHSRMETP